MSDELEPTRCSMEGERRRERIIADAVRFGGRLRRRRRLRNAGLVALAPITAAMIVGYFAKQSAIVPELPRIVALALSAAQSAPPTSSHIAAASPTQTIGGILMVAPDPTVMERYRTKPVASMITRVGDDDLIRSLNAAGVQGGLATIGSTTLLLVDGVAVR